MRHCLAMADKMVKLPSVVNSLITDQGVTPFDPVYVRKEKSTQGHVFVVMLAYLILRRLRYKKSLTLIIHIHLYPQKPSLV